MSRTHDQHLTGVVVVGVVLEGPREPFFGCRVNGKVQLLKVCSGGVGRGGREGGPTPGPIEASERREAH